MRHQSCACVLRGGSFPCENQFDYVTHDGKREVHSTHLRLTINGTPYVCEYNDTEQWLDWVTACGASPCTTPENWRVAWRWQR